MKITRRQMAALAVASTAGAKAFSQAQSPPAANWLQAARESKRDAAAELARFTVEMQLEPAFQFKA
jgi:hypothetical protein